MLPPGARKKNLTPYTSSAESKTKGPRQGIRTLSEHGVPNRRRLTRRGDHDIIMSTFSETVTMIMTMTHSAEVYQSVSGLALQARVKVSQPRKKKNLLGLM